MRLYSDYYNKFLEHSLFEHQIKTRKQPDEEWGMSSAIWKYLCVPTRQKYWVGHLKVTNVWQCNETLPLECCDDYSTQSCNTKVGLYPLVLLIHVWYRMRSPIFLCYFPHKELLRRSCKGAWHALKCIHRNIALKNPLKLQPTTCRSKATHVSADLASDFVLGRHDHSVFRIKQFQFHHMALIALNQYSDLKIKFITLCRETCGWRDLLLIRLQGTTKPTFVVG